MSCNGCGNCKSCKGATGPTGTAGPTGSQAAASGLLVTVMKNVLTATALTVTYNPGDTGIKFIVASVPFTAGETFDISLDSLLLTSNVGLSATVAVTG